MRRAKDHVRKRGHTHNPRSRRDEQGDEGETGGGAARTLAKTSAGWHDPT